MGNVGKIIGNIWGIIHGTLLSAKGLAESLAWFAHQDSSHTQLWDMAMTEPAILGKYGQHIPCTILHPTYSCIPSSQLFKH